MTKEEAKKKLGANIKALRLAWKETQDDLAYAIGLDENTNISYYENGKRYPKPDIIFKILYYNPLFFLLYLSTILLPHICLHLYLLKNL